ncbi:MAG: redoxin domain-containing protein [Halobacteriales archaeon]
MVEIGETAPAFELPDTTGGSTSLTEVTESGPAVLVFNRGTWCSYCAEQLQTFSALEYDLWRHLNVDIVPIVGDPVPELVEMRDRFDLGLQLCADTDLTVSRQYGGIEESETHGEIPLAATYVIDETGTIRYAQVAENPADRTYANYIRAFIRDGFEKPYQ